MRQKSLDVLEFDKIKLLVENEAISDLGKRKSYRYGTCNGF